MIAYILCGVIALQATIHHLERRDLYNRIMSRSLTEYKGEKCHSAQSAHDRVLRRWRGTDGEEACN